ncbi:MFS transporter [Effusibacillus consociatus]|uniref:MFS transporter n=1 Tax=Effusibacillus consociatus TaxID=1117041 RepID=A0ABV9Q7P9_9BACL
MGLNRNAWLLIGGQSVSIVGDSLLVMVLPLMVLDLTGSALQVSVVFILTQLPNFLAFLSGRMRKYFTPKTLIFFYDLSRFVILLIISTLLYLNTSLIYLVYFLFFVMNLFSTLFRPTRIEFITHIVSEDSLRKFNSYDRTLEAVATAVGFGLGGYAYHYLPLQWVFALNSLTFFISGISILFLKTSYQGAGLDNKHHVKISFWETVVSVSKNKTQSFLMYGETMAGVAFGIFMAMFVVYARHYLSVDSITIGHLEMLQSFFATMAGFLISWGLVKVSDRVLGLIGYSGMALSMVLMGLNSIVWPVFFLMAIIGFFNMMYAVAVRTLLQTNSPKEELIHIFAYESILSRTAFIVGAGMSGGLLSYSGLTANWVILSAGIILFFVAAWGFQVLFVQQKKLPERMEEEHDQTHRVY